MNARIAIALLIASLTTAAVLPANVARADEVAPQVVFVNQLKSCKSLKCPAVAGLIKMNKAIWPLIKTGLAAPDEMTRFWTLGVLSEVPMVQAVGAIAAMLADPKIRVRAAAAYALGAIKDKAVSPHLVKALADKDLNVRFAAALALARIKDPATMGPLIVATRDRDEDVRAYACLALGDIGLATVVPTLLERLDQDAHPKVRGFAAMSLSKINDPRSLKPLLARLKEETNGKAYAAAVFALGELRDRSVLKRLQKLESTLSTHLAKSVRESTEVAEYLRDAVDKLRATKFGTLGLTFALPPRWAASGETATGLALGLSPSGAAPTTGIPGAGQLVRHPKSGKSVTERGAALAGSTTLRVGDGKGVKSVVRAAVVKATYLFDGPDGVVFEVTFTVAPAEFDEKALDRAIGSVRLL